MFIRDALKSVGGFCFFKYGFKTGRGWRRAALVLALVLLFGGGSALAAEGRIEAGSFDELKAALTNPDNAGQTIYLTADIETLGATVAADAIAAGVKVDGQGQFAIKGDRTTSFFLKGGQVQNLILENFMTAFDIADGEDVGDISDVTFKDNEGKKVSYSSYGGGIYNSGTIGTIADSLFEGNTANFGGAIYNEGAIDSIVNTSFSNNSGRAIYNGGTIDSIVNSSFINNTADNSGAIYNSGTIDSIVNTSFSNNSGRAIYNGGTIDSIVNSSFSNNSGGAIYNGYRRKIGTIADSTFEGNTASYNGMIHNNDYSTIDSIVNSSFINNTNYGMGVISNGRSDIGRIEDSIFEGNTASIGPGVILNYYSGQIGEIVNTSFLNNTGINMTGIYEMGDAWGGAIFSTTDLQIAARGEGKESVFSGNKHIMTDDQGNVVSESSNAIVLGDMSSLKLSATEGGKVKFDDGILAVLPELMSSDDFEEAKQELIASGGTVTQDGDEWILSVPQNDILTESYKIQDLGNGFYGIVSEEMSFEDPNMPADEVLAALESAEQQGLTVNCNADKSLCTANGTIQGFNSTATFTQNADGSYHAVSSMVVSAPLYITGDDSGKVEFNNTIGGFGAVDISGATTDFNNGVGTVRNVRIATGAANVNSGATLKNVEVNNGGRLAVNDGGSVYQTAVNEGGQMSVAANGYAEDTTVNSGGALDAAVAAKLHNLLANGGAILDIDSGAVLTGNIILDANAELGGSYDYNKIFKDEVADEGSLTLVGGLNNLLQANSLVNTTADKRLNLASGYYAIGDGTQVVAGWDKLTVKDNATVKLEGDIRLSGADKNINLLQGTELNLAGHSPSNYQIVGSLNNDGHVNFSHAGDGADDVTTIFGNYKAYANAEMTIDVDPIANKADELIVQGDVEGTTKVVINPLSNDQTTDKVLFVSAPNDLADTAAHFEIFRVIGDAHAWNVLYADNNWYVGTDNIIINSDNNGYGDNSAPTEDLDDETQADAVLPPDMPEIPEFKQPDNSGGGNDGKAKVYGEAVAYAGLPAMGIEQTRDMLRHIVANVENAKEHSAYCGGFYDCYYDRKPQTSAWVSPVYARAEVDAPIKFEADISGLEGGFDVQNDVYNRLGVFMSYRKGQYDLDGSGDDIYSDVGSEVDINSYAAGLYHRYDKGRVWTMTSVYGGWQDVKATTNDGVKADTDGFMFGGSVEGGLVFAPQRDLTVEPSVRLAYAQVNYADMSDKYGKTAEYGTVRNIEAETGVKVEKTLRNDYRKETGKVYIKPSVIQNFGKGNVTTTSLNKVDGLDDVTLWRIETGGNINFANKWSAYIAAAYTCGADYTNASFNVGLRYSF